MANNFNKNSKPGAIIIEGHVQGLSNTRSLGEAGIPVYVVDKNDCIARYSKYCRKFFKCPDFLNEKFVVFLMELAKKEGIKNWCLIPSNDHAIYNISKHKYSLEKYFKVITPTIDTIENIYDKPSLLNIARKTKVKIPITHCFLSANDKIPENLHPPFLTKGRNGLSFYKTIGKKALLAHDEKELNKQLSYIDQKYNVSKTFTQELLRFNGSNHTISFTAFCVEGEIKTHWTGIKLREHPVHFGTATFTKSTYIEACHLNSIPLIKALKYTGVCEIEYIQDTISGEYKLIEINPRTWLWVGLAKECGVNYALMIYNFVNNITFEYPKKYKYDIYWINSITDTIFALKAVINGYLSLKDYFLSLSKKKIKAVFDKNDIVPSLVFPLLLLKRAFRNKINN